jgi:hypothetical protein
MTESRYIKRNAVLESRFDLMRAIAAGQDIVDLGRTVEAQREWSFRAFGPGRVAGVLAHLRKEIDEIEAAPTDLEEWADALILVIDGMWRATGASGLEFARVVLAKMAKNRARKWPAPGTVPEGQPVEHVRGEDE